MTTLKDMSSSDRVWDLIIRESDTYYRYKDHISVLSPEDRTDFIKYLEGRFKDGHINQLLSQYVEEGFDPNVTESDRINATIYNLNPSMLADEITAEARFRWIDQKEEDLKRIQLSIRQGYNKSLNEAHFILTNSIEYDCFKGFYNCLITHGFIDEKTKLKDIKTAFGIGAYSQNTIYSQKDIKPLNWIGPYIDLRIFIRTLINLQKIKDPGRRIWDLTTSIFIRKDRITNHIFKIEKHQLSKARTISRSFEQKSLILAKCCELLKFDSRR